MAPFGEVMQRNDKTYFRNKLRLNIIFLSGALEITVAHICHGKTYFYTTKNLLFHGKTYFATAKLTFPRRNLLFHGKTYFSTAKLTLPRQNLLCHGKTSFPRQNLLFHVKTYFATAKLTFPRQNLNVTSFPPQNLIHIGTGKRSVSKQNQDGDGL